MRGGTSVAVVVLAALFLFGAGAGAWAAPPSAATARAWGFDRSDLAPHPDVRFGVLPGGLRYALMRGPAGTGGLSARMRVDAGSTAQGADERGFMHLIEHLIFEGSTKLARGALPRILPPQGLENWSDFNAYTSFDETVYRLDLARADASARATALLLMREICGNLLFTRRAVEGARAMVRTEIGARNGGQDRMMTARNAFFTPGAPIARGPVAGTQADVARANGAALRRLYARTYVPERTTLVLVGDFDPAVVEAEIIASFADWRATVPVARPIAPSMIPSLVLKARGGETRLFVDPAAATMVSFAMARPLGGADAGARRDAVFLEQLGHEMMNRRLAGLAARADAPFAGGAAMIYDHFSTARLALVDVTARDRDWRRALGAGAFELARALDGGFSPAELDAQLAASRRALDADAAPKSRRALADAIVDAAGRQIVFTVPGDASANRAYLARVRLADVNAAFRAAWTGSGRLVFVSHDKPIPGAEAAIAAALRVNDGAASQPAS